MFIKKKLNVIPIVFSISALACGFQPVPDGDGQPLEVADADAGLGFDLSDAGSDGAERTADLPDASGDLPDASGDLADAGGDRSEVGNADDGSDAETPPDDEAAARYAACEGLAEGDACTFETEMGPRQGECQFPNDNDERLGCGRPRG